MKHLLLAAGLLGLASCSTDSDPTHAAVSDYIKKNIGDPDSYKPVRWGKPATFRQKQVDSLESLAMMPAYQAQIAKAQGGLDTLNNTGAEPDSKEWAAIKARMTVAAGRADSLAAIGQKLKDSKNPEAVGVVVMHAFRAKNKLGVLVLDSAQFVVFKTGKVEQL